MSSQGIWACALQTVWSIFLPLVITVFWILVWLVLHTLIQCLLVWSVYCTAQATDLLFGLAYLLHSIFLSGQCLYDMGHRFAVWSGTVFSCLVSVLHMGHRFAVWSWQSFAQCFLVWSVFCTTWATEPLFSLDSLLHSFLVWPVLCTASATDLLFGLSSLLHSVFLVFSCLINVLYSMGHFLFWSGQSFAQFCCCFFPHLVNVLHSMGHRFDVTHLWTFCLLVWPVLVVQCLCLVCVLYSMGNRSVVTQLWTLSTCVAKEAD